LGIRFDDLQLRDDLCSGPVSLGVAGVNVAAGGDVVVVLLQLGVIDDAAEFVLLRPFDQDVGDTMDACGQFECAGRVIIALWFELFEIRPVGFNVYLSRF
jgi:hypothetical protein